MRSKLMFALPLVAALTTTLTVEGKALAASDLGIAIMSAQVDRDGHLQGGAGVVGVKRIGAGEYFVAFGRSVEGCTYTGTTSGKDAYLNPGFVAATELYETLNGVSYYGVRVTTLFPGPFPVVDRPFHVLVFCSK